MLVLRKQVEETEELTSGWPGEPRLEVNPCQSQVSRCIPQYSC